MSIPKKKPANKIKPEVQSIKAKPAKEEDPVVAKELDDKDQGKKRIKEAL